MLISYKKFAASVITDGFTVKHTAMSYTYVTLDRVVILAGCRMVLLIMNILSVKVAHIIIRFYVRTLIYHM